MKPIKHYLDELRKLENEIRKEEHLLEQLRSKLNPHSPNLDKIGGYTGPHDRIGEIMPLIVDLERTIPAKKDEVRKLKQNIESALQSMTDYRFRLGVTYHYLNGLDWESTAKAIGGKENAASIQRYCFVTLKKIEGG